MTPDEFRRYGHQLIDWIADYRAQVAERPVMAPTRPGDVRRALPESPPEAPEPFDDVLADLDRTVVPNVSHWAHPRFFGYFPCNGDLSSVLGDLASTGLGVLGLAWQSSPALTEVEEVATGWLRQMVGLSADWSGVIQDTASTSSLVALLLARERTTNYAPARGGLQAEPSPLVVYTTAHSHSSIEKAALLAGFGRTHVRVVAHDANWAMRPDALEGAIATDRAAGARPCAVVATTGTTTTTAVRPARLDRRSGRPRGPLAPRRRGDGRFGDDPPRVPLDVARHRSRRFDCRSIRTSGWVRHSIAPCSSCGIRITSSG